MKRYTYVTLLSTSSYVPGVLVLYKSLRRFSNLPFLCVCSKDIDKESMAILSQSGIETKILSESVLDSLETTELPLQARGLEHWKYTFDKLFIWTLTEYDKVVFIDSDMMICSNIDSLFERKDLSAVQAGHFLYPDWIRLNSGIMVITPNIKTYNRLKSCIIPTIEERNIKGQGSGDQDVINYCYQDWTDKTDLHLEDRYNLFFDHIESYNALKLPPPMCNSFRW